MNLSVEHEVAPAAGSSIVALSIGILTLFLTRDEIHTLDIAEDMEPASPQEHELGWHQVQGERIPVYGLGEGLTPLKQRPLTSRITVVLIAGDALIAILCDDIAFLTRDELSFQEIPDCMNRRRPLITGLAIHNGAVGCVTTSERLATWFLNSSDPSTKSLTP